MNFNFVKDIIIDLLLPGGALAVAICALKVSISQKNMQLKPNIVAESVEFRISFIQIEETRTLKPSLLLGRTSENSFYDYGCIPIYNIGYGTAVDIEYEWSYDKSFYEEIINARRGNAKLLDFDYKTWKFKFEKKQYRVISNESKFDNHILPVNIKNDYHKLYLPSELCMLFDEVISYDCKRVDDYDDYRLRIEMLPKLFLDIKYYDTERRAYKKTIILNFEVEFVDLERDNNDYLSGRVSIINKS
jgi:hypothetical protein